ncbi:hypothetical protein Mal4_42680 [Maioricimonas rarisocia]|uniref:DUF2752 domain-containing protein n=2 Tax=Maioricimonas rarisocia TaxID=2528026 RepID=A0A517ZBP1_9PLAN|nr:hypothetical protein Mal4_42680 [Maioricimonas rarisocia]
MQSTERDKPLLRPQSDPGMTPAPSLKSKNSQFVEGYPLVRASRVLLLAWSLFLIAGFGLAFWLDPDPRGYGTHTRLGLPPCSLRILFGIPCPSCGGTTAFAHFVRGQWIAAVEANVAAFVLAVTCATMIPWCWYSAWRGRLWKVTDPSMALLSLLLVLAGVSAVQWLVWLIVPVAG